MKCKVTNKSYDFTNHLGNVLVTVTDRRNPIESLSNPGTIGWYEADVVSAQDYYPFGMLQPGRQGSFAGYDTTGTDTSVSVTLRFKLDSALAVNNTIFLEIHYSPPDYQEFELTFYRSGWTIQDYYADILQFQEPGISTGFSNGEIFLTFDLTTLGINCNTDVLVFGSQHLDLVQAFQCDTHIVPIVETKMIAGGYRFGFNSMERDDEWKGAGNSLDFGARIYDSRLGGWLSIDPFYSKYPSMTPYHFAVNNPIVFVDYDGRVVTIYYHPEVGQTTPLVYTAGMVANTGNKFFNDVINSFNYIYENVEGGKEAIDMFIESKINYQVRKSKKNRFQPKGFIFHFNNEDAVEFRDGVVYPPVVNLAHEIDHAQMHKTLILIQNEAYDLIENAREEGRPQEEIDKLYDVFESLQGIVNNFEDLVNQLDEEQRATEGLERNAARSLGLEYRDNYSSSTGSFKVNNPIYPKSDPKQD